MAPSHPKVEVVFSHLENLNGISSSQILNGILSFKCLIDRSTFSSQKLRQYILFLTLSQTNPGFYVSAVLVF